MSERSAPDNESFSNAARAATPGNLAETYRWFQNEILRRNASPGRTAAESPTATEAIGTPSPGARVEDVLTPSRMLSSEERLGIYAESYFLRLRDVLASDFVAVRRTIGAERFTQLARSYLTRFPSNHYSLNYLGERFADYILRFHDEDEIPDAALLVDLARVEHAMARIIDDEECPSLSAETLAGLPAESWGRSRLRPIAALELFALEHAVNRRITEARGDAELPACPRRPSWIAVYRVDYRVIRLDLSRFEYELLVALLEGTTILEAIERAAASWEGDDEELGHVVYASFNRLAAEGLFTAIE